ncbi:MAG: transposase [Planctomycetota bacterium]|nr:transposase [Planctomycetota bacterium]MDI6787206.1 transposase [Planctomycetota bacterium]
MSRAVYLTNEQWKAIKPLLPRLKSKGRPWKDNRSVLEGILWVFRTGVRWKDLPDKYPSLSTCWRRLKLWERKGIWLNIWRKFINKLDRKGQINWSECFMDGSFIPAKKGAHKSTKPSRARVRSLWW